VGDLHDREKSLDRQLRAFHWVRVLAELPRLAGTPAEAAAAERIEAWLRELGVEDVTRVPVESRPPVARSLALHLALAALGCWTGGGLGVLLTGAAALSFHREFARRGRVLSRVLPAPGSLNVVARAGARAPAQRVVLSAHMDCAQAGWIFSERLTRLFARGSSRGARDGAPPAGPHALPRLLVFAAAVLALAGWLGAGGFLLGAASALLSLALLAGVVLCVQWALAPPSPGANDNASAVAAMLTCAEQLLAQLPERTELWVVATGAEEVGCCGMHAFCDEHVDWPREATFFVNFECVGGGELHFVRSEGTLGKTVYPPLLLELARRIGQSGVFGEIAPVDLLAGTDGHVPARAGFPTLSLISLEDGVPRHYHRPSDLPEAVDTGTLIRAADFGAAVAYAALRGEAGPIAIV
jgi:hypothetical protein